VDPRALVTTPLPSTSIGLQAPKPCTDSLGRTASSPRGGSLVLPPRPGWRDLAGRCWHARPPAASTPPTNPASEPTDGRQLISSADFVGFTACPWGSLGMPRWHRPPGSKGRADRPARHQEGAHHDRAQRQLRRQPHRPARGPLHRGWHRPGHVPGGGVGAAGAGGVVLHRDRGRDQAEHAAQSLSKGSRVVVVGRLQQRSWTAEDGSARSTVEVVAEELGRACGGRRRRRPGPRGVRIGSQLDRCDGAGRR
jgi:Single-strand binding protein family